MMLLIRFEILLVFFRNIVFEVYLVSLSIWCTLKSFVSFLKMSILIFRFDMESLFILGRFRFDSWKE